jgi:CheY-like chemotaxis protein
VASADEATRSPAQTNNDALRGVRILLVDDEPDALELTTALLRFAGAEVSAVPSAAEAVRAIENARPEVLISDIGMPGQDGYHLIQDLRLRGFRFAAIALTAYGRSEDREQAFKAGFQVHLPKPADPRELTTAILSLLGKTP